MSEAVPDMAREAYFFTSGPAWKESLPTSTRMSSRRAVYCPSVRNVSSAAWVPAFRASFPARFTPFPPLAITMPVATRRSSVMAALKPPAR
ncbi:hypothetical protein SSAG_01221 [Streptomyces sp. Mg1]|nr:hypothetical protein SSAG_01221 [Streptomyces sp. Mg1]